MAGRVTWVAHGQVQAVIGRADRQVHLVAARAECLGQSLLDALLARRRTVARGAAGQRAETALSEVEIGLQVAHPALLRDAAKVDVLGP